MSLSIRNLAIGIVIGLAIGLVSGYVLTPKGDTVDLEQRIDELEEQVSNLQTAIDNKDAQTSNLQAQLDEKNTQITSLQARISEKDVEITDLESQIQEKNSRISELEQLVPPYRRGEWNLIVTFQGQSETITDYFYIAGTELRINWTWTSSVEEFASFGISLYEEGQTTSTEWFFNLQKEGTAYVHNIEAANYYLDISEANLDQWRATVEVFTPE